MADWSKPSLTDAYAAVLAEIMARDLSAATLSYSNDANIPNGAIRWNPNTFQFEIFSSSGGNWSALTTQLNIGALLLGQNAEPNTMQAIPRMQADAAYQPLGSYAALIGSKTQPFLAANATDPQHSTPLNQTQSLIAAAVAGLASQGLASQGWTTQQIAAAVAALPNQTSVTQQITAALAGMATQSWVNNKLAQIPAGFQGIYLANTTTPMSVVIPSNVTNVFVRMFGGGGGGSGNIAASSLFSGQGGYAGGNGGYVEAILPVTPGEILQITPGAPGAAGLSGQAPTTFWGPFVNPTNGGNGGTSYCGSSLSASGGTGGIATTANGSGCNYGGSGTPGTGYASSPATNSVVTTGNAGVNGGELGGLGGAGSSVAGAPGLCQVII